jgi:hypothetical protein
LTSDHFRTPITGPSVFTTTIPFEPERVHAVAVYCSDGRYGDHIDAFLHDHLNLPNYDRLAIPGGPAWLTYRGSASLLQYGLLHEQLDFLVSAHGLCRAVLIAHYGCAYYLHRHAADAESVLPAQFEDLQEATLTLSNWHPSLQVERYLARAAGGCVRFEEVPPR